MLAVALAMTMVAAGCGDDDEGGTTSTTEEAAPGGAGNPTSTTSGGSGGSGAAAGSVTVGTLEYSFEAPETIEGGVVEMELDNQGEEEHHVQFARLNDGVTFEDFTAAFQQGEEAALPLVTFEGGVGTTVGGNTNTATTELAAGSYALICFVSGADGVPHAAKGMVSPIEVTEPAEEIAPPETEVTVSMTDFDYELPEDFEATGVVEFVNDGEQAHEANIVALGEGDSETFLEFFAEPAGPPPFTSSGGFQAVSPGAGGGFFDLSQLPAGRYAFVCFIPDVLGDGAPHFTKGMIEEFEVS